LIALLSFFVKVTGNVAMSHWLGVPGILAGTALMHATTLICYICYTNRWAPAPANRP
jgi:putative peptidoglycan lipid II flippase